MKRIRPEDIPDTEPGPFLFRTRNGGRAIVRRAPLGGFVGRLRGGSTSRGWNPNGRRITEPQADLMWRVKR